MTCMRFVTCFLIVFDLQSSGRSVEWLAHRQPQTCLNFSLQDFKKCWGTQIPRARSPWRLHFVRWLLVFVDPHIGAWFVSPVWHLEFLGGFLIFGKFCTPIKIYEPLNTAVQWPNWSRKGSLIWGWSVVILRVVVEFTGRMWDLWYKNWVSKILRVHPSVMISTR